MSFQQLVQECAEKSLAPVLDEIEKFRIDHKLVLAGLVTRLDEVLSRLERVRDEVQFDSGSEDHLTFLHLASVVAVARELIGQVKKQIELVDQLEEGLLLLPQQTLDLLLKLDIPVDNLRDELGVREFRERTCSFVDKSLRPAIERTETSLKGILSDRDRIIEAFDELIQELSAVLANLP